MPNLASTVFRCTLFLKGKFYRRPNATVSNLQTNSCHSWLSIMPNIVGSFFCSKNSSVLLFKSINAHYFFLSLLLFFGDLGSDIPGTRAEKVCLFSCKQNSVFSNYILQDWKSRGYFSVGQLRLLTGEK